MDRKIAVSVLTFIALNLAYSRGEEEGKQQILSKEGGSGPRVPKSSKIIYSIDEHFRNIL